MDPKTASGWIVALGVAALLLQGLGTWYQYQQLQIAKAG
jgi:hypothetical protein